MSLRATCRNWSAEPRGRPAPERDWGTAAAIDLAGRDILDAVQTSVNPKVIDCPDQRGPRSTIDAVARDGIQLKVKARVTVRTNLRQLVGGATEETVIARRIEMTSCGLISRRR